MYQANAKKTNIAIKNKNKKNKIIKERIARPANIEVRALIVG